MSCPLLSSPVLSCPLLSSPVVSCRLRSSSVVSCRLLSCRVVGALAVASTPAPHCSITCMYLLSVSQVTVVRPWHISDASGAASGAGATAGSTASGEAAGRTSGDSGGPPTLLPHRSPSAQHLTTAKPLRSGPVMASHLCATCQLERPDRAKHCRVCDRCVPCCTPPPASPRSAA